MKERLLIVGAGMASAYLLQELSKQAHDLDVTVIGEEEQSCYNRVLLSSVLAGEKDAGELPMLSESTLAGAKLISGVRIEALDCERGIAFTQRGSEHSFDRLVLATGSQVALPKIAQLHIEGIEVFRSIEDTQHLLSLQGTGRSAVVVGGGLLGLEAAHGLNALGFTTTVVHRNRSLMNRQLDDAGSSVLQASLEKRGMIFSLGCEISELHHSNRKLTAVSLTNGDFLPCDILLFATGISPNVELAKKSGVVTDRGILVDARLQTTRSNVYALGECSQLGKHCFGLVAPVRAQAKVLAQTLRGAAQEEFRIQDWPTQLKISGIEIFRAGQLDASAENILLSSPTEGIYRRLLVRDNQLVGAVLVGDKRHGTWYSQLIEEGTDIGQLRSSLMFGPGEPPGQTRGELAA